MPGKQDIEQADGKTPRTFLDEDESSNGSCEDFTGHGSEDYGKLTAAAKNNEEQVVIATSETKKVFVLRATLILVLLAVAGCVSFAVYWTSRSSEQTEFESVAQEACRKVATTFRSMANRRVGTIENLAVSISVNAAAQGERWPMVTIPGFEKLASKTMDLAAVFSLALIPLVTGENLEAWNRYSYAHQGWLHEGLEYHKTLGINHSEWQDQVEAFEKRMGKRPNATIEPGVFPLGSNRTHYNASVDIGPFFPWWQSSPCFYGYAAYNYDTMSHPVRRNEIKALVETEKPLVGKANDYAAEENQGKRMVLDLYLHFWQGGGKQYQDGPASDLYFPVFEETATHTGKLVALLTAYVYWQAYFEDILPPGTEPVVVVLENLCGTGEQDGGQQQQFTYQIRGEDATYLGPGDLHDRKYDDLGETTGWHALLDVAGTHEKPDGNSLPKGQCIYNVNVYPSQEMENALSTNGPVYFMLVVLSTFIFTSLIFFAYDYYVERRQKKVMTKAVKSTKVVQELFPENVRSRLFDDDDNESQQKQRKSPFAVQYHDRRLSGDGDDDVTQLVDGQNRRTKAVADLYENCTVFFADIAGFTKWSSNREPAHVFQLLETLYGAFDKIAKRRGVFKVETIGDCYLAITGVPKPQKEHAVIMAKFASDCMEQMNYLIHSELVNLLGVETAQLKLRVGIHSGPVTAGVLRGERARFQLFGDTVNTASRMESNSLPGMIQVSSETAELLRAAGKGGWLSLREGGMQAKGKGILITYWMHPKRQTFTASSGGTASRAGGAAVSSLDSSGGGLVSNMDTSGDGAVAGMDGAAGGAVPTIMEDVEV